MAFDSVSGKEIIENETDKRICVGLCDALNAKPCDEEYKRVWKFLYVAGVVSTATPPYAYSLPF